MKKKNIYKSYFGLPNEVRFCKKSLISNQRPNSEIEFKHTIKTKKQTIAIDNNGISDAWKFSQIKNTIDWNQREKELLKLLDKHRGKHGQYDCIVPGSGGKDSGFQAHILKYKYKMNPLTITWPPILYTDYGYKNFKNWIDIGGFDNLALTRNGGVMKKLTKLAIENLFHPFQTFILGQKNIAPKIALKYNIPLIFYGENEAEYGNPIADNETSLREKSFYTYKNIDQTYIGGLPLKQLINNHNINIKDIESYLPLNENEFKNSKIEVHYLGYYLKWTPQEAYYYSVENTGFKPRPYRSQGTFSKYSSIDDKIDDLHYYTTFIKFGIGRATYDASQEIRNNHLTVEEGKRLIKKYDGEFPDRYFSEIIDYLEIDKNHFFKLCNKFRSPHLWGKNVNDEWKLRHTVNQDGLDD